MKRVLAITAAVALSTFGIVVASTPAHASGISPGRAVVRIDAPTAIVQSTGVNTYRIVLAKGASGQWMGERKVKSGKKRSLVRDLTASKFAKNWKNFKYSSAGVGATLSWGKDAGFNAVVIKLAQPKVTSAGVVFDFSSDFSIPAQLTDAAINVQRAPSGKRSVLTEYTISGGLMYSLNVMNTFEVKARIYNEGNNNTCWGTKDIKADQSKTPASDSYAATGANTCANVHYEDEFTFDSNAGEKSYGAYVKWPVCTSDNVSKGAATMTLDVLPNGEHMSFMYVQSNTLSCS